MFFGTPEDRDVQWGGSINGATHSKIVVYSWEIHIFIGIRLSINGGIPKKWLVFVRENPVKMDDEHGKPHLWKLPDVTNLINLLRI